MCGEITSRRVTETFSLIEDDYGSGGMSDHRYVWFRVAWSERDAKE